MKSNKNFQKKVKRFKKQFQKNLKNGKNEPKMSQKS